MQKNVRESDEQELQVKDEEESVKLWLDEHAKKEN